MSIPELPSSGGRSWTLAYEALLQPLELKGVRVRNRIMFTAHTSGAGQDGMPKERYQRYQEERAWGGVGLTVVGGSAAVAVDSPGAAMNHLDASSDEIIPWYRQLSGRIHAHGATAFGQLSHMGRRANWDNERWLPPVAPSLLREPAHRAYPKEMEDWDFGRIIEAYAAAAARIRAGGLDGVELSACHSHLLDQFWSPLSSRRTDDYGGSLRNRTRFALEVLAAVREAVGEDFVVGVRMSADELVDGGLTHEDCIAIARILVAEGGVDYLSVVAGQAENLPAHAVVFPGMAVSPAPYLHLARGMKEAVSVPVFHAQRIDRLEVAARAVAEGHVDMVGMTRAHMADPHIVRKLLEGRPHDIRPCVGANYCIDRNYAGGQAFCLHNAATGREETMPHVVPRARQRRRVVVVGAGPAGLEAARVCAERGHEVVLFERAEIAGGAVNVAARAPGRSYLLAIVRWLERQARNRGVALRLGTEATSGLVLADSPDVVIVATGGHANVGPIAGAEHVVTCWAVLAGQAPPAGRRVLVFDDNGNESALSCAALLAGRGCSVDFVTADPAPGPLLERTTRPVFLRRLYDADVRFTVDCRLVEVRQEAGGLAAVLVNEYNDARRELLADDVVVEYGARPEDALYHELKPRSTNLGEVDLPALVVGRPQQVLRNEEGAFSLFRIGDAVASRNIHAAVYDALRLCKEL